MFCGMVVVAVLYSVESCFRVSKMQVNLSFYISRATWMAASLVLMKVCVLVRCVLRAST